MQETDRRLRKLDELFTGQWGKLMEALVEGDLSTLLNRRGIRVDHTVSNPRKEHGARRWEIDILAVNGDQVVVVEVEVKTTLKVSHVDHLLGLLPEFTELMPEYGSRRIHGAVAYLKADESSARYAERQGLFVIRATGGSAGHRQRRRLHTAPLRPAESPQYATLAAGASRRLPGERLADALQAAARRFQPGVQREGVLEAADGLVEPAKVVQRGPPVGVGLGVVGADLDQPPIQVERRLVPLLPEPHQGKVVEDFRVPWIELQGTFEMVRRRLRSSQFQRGPAHEPLQPAGQGRVRRQCSRRPQRLQRLLVALQGERVWPTAACARVCSGSISSTSR